MFNEKQAVGRCSQEVTHRRRITCWAPGALTLIRKLPTDKAQASLNAPLWTLIWPILRPWTLYSFLRAAITKYHKLESLNSRLPLVAPEGYEGESVPRFSLLPVVFWPTWAFLGLWTHRPDLCLYVHLLFSLDDFLCPHFPFL